MRPPIDLDTRAESASTALPSGWELGAVGEAVQIAAGQVDPRVEPFASLPHVGPENIEPGTGRLISHSKASDLGLISGKYQFRRGDIVYSKIRPYLRKVWLATFSGLSSADMYPLSVNEGFEPGFVSLFLLSDRFTRQATASQDRTGIPKVNREQLKSCMIPKPPVSEQLAIASALSRVQQALAIEVRRVGALNELKAATMATVFREGLHGEEPRSTEIGNIPSGWEISELADLCRPPDGRIQTGPFGSQLHSSDYVADGIPILNPTHMEAGRVVTTGIPRVAASDAQRLAKHRLLTGDILFSRRGDVGRHIHISLNEEGWLCGTGCLLVRVSASRIDSLYLSYALDTPFAQDYLRSHATGTIMPNINTKVLASIPIPIPTRDEQRAIALLLTALDDRIRAAASRQRHLAQLFHSALHQLMTGRLRVTPPLEHQPNTHA